MAMQGMAKLASSLKHSKNPPSTKSLVTDELIPIEQWDIPGIQGITETHLCHPHIDKWNEWLSLNWKRNSKIAVFTLCASRKPYRTAVTVRSIIKPIKGYIDNLELDFFIISSIGVCPWNYQDYYPFAHYSWDGEESPEIKKKYIEVNTRRVKNFLKDKGYKYCIGYFRPKSESRIALNNACKELGIPCLNLPSKSLVDSNRHNLLYLFFAYLINNNAKRELVEVIDICLKRDLTQEEINKYQCYTEEELKVIRKEESKIKLGGKRKKAMENNFKGMFGSVVEPMNSVKIAKEHGLEDLITTEPLDKAIYKDKDLP